ncbi:hypothetical protein [Nitratireductor sp.]|uniref:hypothetical protein n=1 Tax=Nitratireductor sp. TaxID=1872084 RepID=UPI0025F63E44|nr:hypothetical protein [Nitratireductor sp.]
MPSVEQLLCRPESIEAIDAVLKDPKNPLVKAFFDVVAKYGTPEEINEKANKARDIKAIKERLKAMKSPYLADLEWLEEQRDKGAFVSMDEYYTRVLGSAEAASNINQDNAVTLEISAVQFFPWLISEAQHSIRDRSIMPGRYIRVRNMKESEQDRGDLLAIAGAMQIIGASYVETLDTKGTDGSNVHLGGPDTIAGYFGGLGMPNDYPLKWLDEYLHYYTTYGIRQVLNVSQGQLMIGYWLNKIGVDNEFKISVFYSGHDSAFGAYFTFVMAKLMEREDGRVPLIGLNLSNSVSSDTIRQIATLRDLFGMREKVRIEHHVTETYKHIVQQPYLRRDQLVEVAATVSNIAAKHEGGEPAIEAERAHPSDCLEYFCTLEELERTGHMAVLEQNYLDKHHSINLTADALTKAGIGFVGARNLHK